MKEVILGVLFLIGYLTIPASAYFIETTFDTVEEAVTYLVHVGTNTFTTTSIISSQCEVIVPGGLDYDQTDVWIHAVANGTTSTSSNTLQIPAQKTFCQRLDLNNDGVVSASDNLIFMTAIVENQCQ